MTAGRSTSKPTVALFLAALVLTTTVFITTAGNSPDLSIDFRPGGSVMNRTIGELILWQSFNKPFLNGLASKYLSLNPHRVPTY